MRICPCAGTWTSTSLRTWQRPRALARLEQSTLFAAILAAWKLVLFAATGQPDIRVATFASGRSVAGTEHIVGLFSNVVCLRTRVDPARRFRDLVRAVQATLADATTNQDVPFQTLLRALREGQPAPAPRLFQTLVLWQALPVESLRLPAVETSIYRPAEEEFVLMRDPLDLKLDIVETPTALHGTLAYTLARFTAPDVGALVEALQHCLRRAGADDEVTVDALAGSVHAIAVPSGSHR